MSQEKLISPESNISVLNKLNESLQNGDTIFGLNNTNNEYYEDIPTYLRNESYFAHGFDGYLKLIEDTFVNNKFSIEEVKSYINTSLISFPEIIAEILNDKVVQNYGLDELMRHLNNEISLFYDNQLNECLEMIEANFKGYQPDVEEVRSYIKSLNLIFPSELINRLDSALSTQSHFYKVHPNCIVESTKWSKKVFELQKPNDLSKCALLLDLNYVYTGLRVGEDGNIIIDGIWKAEYNKVGGFSEGLAVAEYKDYSARKDFNIFVNKNGEVVFDKLFDSAKPFSEGLAAVKQNGKWGFINKYGETVIPFDFDYVTSFNGAIAEVTQNGKLGFINKDGEFQKNVLLGRSFFNSETYPLYFYENEGKFGLKDGQNNKVSDAIFEGAFNFSEGLAAVKQNGKWGFIDQNGSFVILPYFEEVSSFTNGLAFVRKGIQSSLLSTSGQMLNYSIEGMNLLPSPY